MNLDDAARQRLEELFQEAPVRLYETVLAMEHLDRNKLILEQQRHKSQCPTLFIYPEISSLPFFNKKHFAHTVRILEDPENLKAMQLECNQVFNDDNNHSKIGTIYSSNYGGVWNNFDFVNQGNIAHDNIAMCPETWRILQEAFGDSICSGSGIGYVYFSRITPGTHITSHCGVCNLRLRLQLPLVVDPSSEAKIRIADIWHTYQEGECIIFDDTFNHEVLYEKDESVVQKDRIVLLVDFWHPELTGAEIEATKLLLPPSDKPDS